MVCSDAVPRKWMIHFERAYKTCCTLSLFLGEHREIIVLFQGTQNTDLLKVVQDFILFLLPLRNLTSVFMSSFEDWKGSSCPPAFERQMPVFSNGPFPAQQEDGIVQPLTARRLDFWNFWRAELAALGNSKMDSVLIPSLTRDTSSGGPQ